MQISAENMSRRKQARPIKHLEEDGPQPEGAASSAKGKIAIKIVIAKFQQIFGFANFI